MDTPNESNDGTHFSADCRNFIATMAPRTINKVQDAASEWTWPTEKSVFHGACYLLEAIQKRRYVVSIQSPRKRVRLISGDGSRISTTTLHRE